MTPAEFTLKTLRQARGSMRQQIIISDRQQMILLLSLDGRWRSLAQFACECDVTQGAVSCMLAKMADKGLLDRIGDRGDYRYSITPMGRALC